MMNRKWLMLLGVVGLALVVGCGDDDDGTTSDAGVDASSDAGPDASTGECTPRDSSVPEDGGIVADAGSQCAPVGGAYIPCLNDDWEECVSDDGTYHPVDPSIGTVARIEAFEDIADLLFDPTADPSAEDFEEARDLYSVEEGLASRVNRRYDPHYEGPDCTPYDSLETPVPEEDRDYCVGAGLLAPTILDGFAAGMSSKVSDPRRVYAARIEAALLWFLYVSPYKESLTCTTTAKDCDSSYAYYTGGQPRSGGIGLARYVRELSSRAHDAAWDGLLGVRCWRDIDSEATATDTELRDIAREQYDQALLDGVAAIVADRLEKMDEATDEDEQAYYFAFFQTLGPVLLRGLEERSSEDADVLRAELESEEPGDVDVPAALEAIGLNFCE